MLELFILCLSFAQFVFFFLEFFMPLWAFNTWKIWVLNKLFPMHGIILILSGIILAMYKGYLSSVIFYIGLFMALTGPIILIYPEKIREAFTQTEQTFDKITVKRLMRFDALARLAFSIILAISLYKSA